MEIRLQIPPDVERVVAYDADGNKVDVARLVIVPAFNRADSRPEILVGTTVIHENTTDQKEVQKFALTVSGASGKAQVSDKSKRVKSGLEQKIAAKATEPTPEPAQADYGGPPRARVAGVVSVPDLPMPTRKEQ